MTDVQFGLLISGLGVVGTGLIGVIKWAFTQWLNDRKEDRVERKTERDERKTERDAQLLAREADRASTHTALFEVNLSLAAMLERDRIRDVRAKRESMPVHQRVPRDFREPQGDEVTDVIMIKERLRAEAMQPRKPTPPVGVRKPTRGHHDEES